MTEAPTDALPSYARWLGRAGLLPFPAASAMIYFTPQNAPVWAFVLATYALAILCFLVGIWWGLALIRRSPAALVYSNIVVLAAFFGHVLLDIGHFLLLCAVLFPLTVCVERMLWLFQPQPAYYARLRMQLSVIATLCLILAAAGQAL